MSDTPSTNAGGIGFAGGLTLLFIGLKITHVIDWSWWWVLSPLWITAVFVVAIFGLTMLVLGKIE